MLLITVTQVYIGVIYKLVCSILQFLKKTSVGSSYYGGIDSLTALSLQAIATNTVLDSLSAWNIFNADFSFTQYNDSISCTNLSTKSDSVVWNFGDGYFSFDENAVHTYNAPGNYTITLSALTNDGCLLDSIFSIVTVVSTTTTEEDNSATKKLIKITDVLGREVAPNFNQTLFYQFNDGTTIKKIIVE